MQDVFLSAWSAVYGHMNCTDLISAAFNDVSLIPQSSDFPDIAYQYFTKPELKIVSPCLAQANLALERAWQNAQLSSKRNHLFAKNNTAKYKHAAIVTGSSLGMIDIIAQQHISPTKKISPYTMSRLRGNAISAPLAIRFGLAGGDYSISAASATGGQAICLAGNLIRMGMADLVAVVCSDRLDSQLTLSALKAIGATTSSIQSRPLSKHRLGMQPVAAAAAVILESARHLHERNKQPLARWLGAAVKNECHHLVIPDPTAEGLKNATLTTLNKNGYEIEQVDWLSMHATGTQAWDGIEASMANSIFSQSLPHISAFKRTFGHTLSAAGLLEAAMVAEGLASGRLPQWPIDLDPSLALINSQKDRQSAKHAMLWSIGMGGTVAVNLLGSLL